MHFVRAKGILSAKNGINIYRGCTHGCIYCDSRSDCYQMNHRFEDVEVKENAPELLENALRRRRERCMIGTGAMSDPYMQCEKDLLLTRRCLEIIDRYGFGATVLTKSDLILRDLDILKSINRKSKCVVQLTMTTFNERLCKQLEPMVCGSKRRYETLKIMHDNGIPTVVWLSPLLPFINDTRENLRGILDYCFAAGVKGILCFGIGTTLREGDREYFYSALDALAENNALGEFAGVKQKYIKSFGNAYSCVSENSGELMRMFYSECRSRGIMCGTEEIFSYLHEFPQDHEGAQLKFELF